MRNDEQAKLIDTEGLEAFTVGQAKNLQIQASGGTPPYTWSTPQGALPLATTLSAGGVISGIPQQAVASITVPITVTDSSSQKFQTRELSFRRGGKPGLVRAAKSRPGQPQVTLGRLRFLS